MTEHSVTHETAVRDGRPSVRRTCPCGLDGTLHGAAGVDPQQVLNASLYLGGAHLIDPAIPTR